MSNTEKPVALITGASRGLGREVALALTRAGWRVVATARSQKALEELDDEVRKLGGEATLVPLDIKDYDGLDRLGAALYERFGKLDGLVANAGVLGDLTPVAHARPAMITDVYSANLIANHRLIRAMDPLLRAAAAARAVFVSSVVAHEARAFWGAYAASKAALEMLVSCLRVGNRDSTPIKVNCIDPGPVRTLMRAKAFPGEDPNTLPTPAEVARLFVEMLSSECTHHGEVVNYRTWKPAA